MFPLTFLSSYLLLIHFQNAEKYGLSKKTGVNHYMRTTCGKTFGVTPKSNQVETPDQNLKNLPASSMPSSVNSKYNEGEPLSAFH